jgi:fumarate reductase subunit C
VQIAECECRVRFIFLLITHHSSLNTACERTFVNIRSQVLLWGAQRVSAMVLALCVVIHLVTIIYAVRNGLSAAEILGRTRGNVGWLAFYAVFVAAVAIHAPIGLRGILAEGLGWRGRSADIFVLAIATSLAVWGWRAVWAVFY